MNKKKKRKKECERKNLPWTVFMSNSWSVYALFVLAGVVQSDSDCDKPGRCARLCCQNCLWGKLECTFLSDMCLNCKLDHSGYLLMEVTCPSSRKSPSQNLLRRVTRRCENWEYIILNIRDHNFPQWDNEVLKKKSPNDFIWLTKLHLWAWI